MRKLTLALSLVSFLGSTQIASADLKAILKLKSPESFAYKLNSTDASFIIPANENIIFSSDTDATASTRSVFIKSDNIFSTTPASEAQANAYLNFKLPRKKKKRAKQSNNTRSSGKNNNKNTRTVGISFKTVDSLDTVANEKVYSVKKFKKKKTKKYFIYSGLVKDGSQGLGRFKVKVNR